MTVYEKQFWCERCRRHISARIHSNGELSDTEIARFSGNAEYRHGLEQHTLCTKCGETITPHTDLDVIIDSGEPKIVCARCAK